MSWQMADRYVIICVIHINNIPVFVCQLWAWHWSPDSLVWSTTCRGRAQPVLWCFHTRARQRQDNHKTNVEPVHSYYAFHTRSDMSGVKGIIGIHRFNFCLVVALLWCENTISPHKICLPLLSCQPWGYVTKYIASNVQIYPNHSVILCWNWDKNVEGDNPSIPVSVLSYETEVVPVLVSTCRRIMCIPQVHSTQTHRKFSLDTTVM